MAEASNEKEAEGKALELLQWVTSSELLMEVPPQIFLSRIIVLDGIPPEGFAFHQSQPESGKFQFDCIPPKLETSNPSELQGQSIYLAQLQVGKEEEEFVGEFSFMAHAFSQEHAEMKLFELLKGAVMSHSWSPVPCHITITRFAVVHEIPICGMIFHRRLPLTKIAQHAYLSGYYARNSNIRVIINEDYKPYPKTFVPLFIVERERTVTISPLTKRQWREIGNRSRILSIQEEINLLSDGLRPPPESL